MITLDNISFSYGKKSIFTDFSLTVHTGERICFFAPSGHGKTTLLRLLCGLEKPKKGNLIFSKPVTFSIMFQDDRLIPGKTVYENIALFGEKDNIPDLLRELGLEEFQNAYPHALSGGLSRRVAMARTLNHGGDVFIFDEPFSGLDQDSVHHCAEIINRYTAGKTLLMVSHSTEEAALLQAKIKNI